MNPTVLKARDTRNTMILIWLCQLLCFGTAPVSVWSTGFAFNVPPLSEAILKRTNNRLGCNEHCPESASESVVVGTGWRNLVDGYINVKIGICLYCHSWPVSDDSEARDLAFVFQKARATDPQIFEGRTDGAANSGIRFGGPRSDHMELSMPVEASPIIEDTQGSVEIKNHKFWVDFPERCTAVLA